MIPGPDWTTKFVRSSSPKSKDGCDYPDDGPGNLKQECVGHEEQGCSAGFLINGTGRRGTTNDDR